MNARYSLKTIACHLGKDSTTISKEIKRNRIKKASKSQFAGGCANKKAYKQKHLCNSKCDRLCKKCSTLNCYRICPNYKEKECHRVLKFPHVCNGCETKLTCKLNKFNYRSKQGELLGIEIPSF